MISTTIATESIGARLRKIISMRERFSSDDIATQSILQALRDIAAEAKNMELVIYEENHLT